MRANRAIWLVVMAVLAAGCGSGKAEMSLAASAAPPPPPPPPAPVQPAAPAEAVIEGDRIKIARPIFYDLDKDEIRPESFSVLDAVANILRTHPEIVALTVEGHTDNQGTVEHNIKLSERRSNAVVRYLVQRGVTTPMTAPGYGAAAPLCFTNDEGCRAMNRRVEFRIKTK
ncbi:OmpA family protein [Sorangium sp. So ce136]|uniref:OmpA family protein n=1 Tax=Sorangium sp. So ce136 TaxID=3133284 RepID=UPI003F0ED80B